jgi:hypothetical protein
MEESPVRSKLVVAALFLLAGCASAPARDVVIAEKDGQWVFDTLPIADDPGGEPRWISPAPFKLESGKTYFFRTNESSRTVVLMVAERRVAK